MLSACILNEGDFYFLQIKIGDVILAKSPITPEFASTLLLLGTPYCD